MSATTWGHVRAALTATIVLAATVGGIAVGVGGATVSPVAVTDPATTATMTTGGQAGPAAVSDGPGGGDLPRHGGHHGR
jgi:hypothetical protein